MDSYLTQCRTHLSNCGSFDSIELVIGNESCDLDSVVAANVLAFIKHIDYSKQESNKRIVIPLLNIARNELKLRTEVVFMFEEVIQMSCDLLICKDDINWKDLKNKNVLLCLVDHNLNKEFSEMGPIVEIIDHHKPCFGPNDCPVSDPSKVMIDTEVGSCCTLIGQRFASHALSDDSQMALMLYGTILLDTICFSRSAQRFSDKDIKVVERLESLLGTDSSSRSEIYQQLIKAKNSINNLNIEELLRKDMKLVECGAHFKIIVSSISGALVSNLNLEDKRKLLEQFSLNNKYDAIVMLGIDNNSIDSIKRDLAVFTKNNLLLQSISSQLESNTSELELKLITGMSDIRIYRQENVRTSRKVILPLISSINIELIVQNEKEDKVIETTNGSPNAKFNELNKETELEIPNLDMSKLNNPESVYGSYIEDSFVGELVGDYVDKSGKDINDLETNWDLNNGINNEIEFDFDSFGPESIIYTGNGDNLEDKILPKLANEEILQNTNSTKDSNTIELIVEKTSEAPVEQHMKEENKEIQSSPQMSSFKTPPNSTSKSDPEKNELALEANDEISPFKRNSSLTISQRKKISPRINLQQILNSSDDLTPVLNLGSDLVAHPLSSDNLQLNIENNTTNYNNGENSETTNRLNPNEDHSNRGLVRRPSSTKKKIPVNREFFTNEDLNDKNESRDQSNQINELTAREELDEMRAWRQSCPIGPEGDVKTIDMKVIDPYKKVISHGGYFHCNASVDSSNHSGSSPAIIVFSACYLPDRSRKDYNYVMDNLFMYVLTTLHNLIADDYILIYFHNAGNGALGNNMPTFGWLKRCYYMIDRRLKKNLKGLYLVHPTFWLKTLIIMSKPFISSKFSKKLKFISSLSELSDLIPIEHIAIPEPVKKIDFDLMIKQKKSRRNR